MVNFPATPVDGLIQVQIIRIMFIHARQDAGHAVAESGPAGCQEAVSLTRYRFSTRL